MDKPLGRVIGPGEDSSQVLVQTRDDYFSRIGEFLCYEIVDQGLPRQVLATISQRHISRSLPASYMADPEVDGSMVASALGLEDGMSGVEYQLTLSTIGYFDQQLGALVNPRINPQPNTIVRLAPPELLQEALFPRQAGSDGAGHIGQMLLRPEIDAVIDLDAMVETHLAILAGTGSGKSYLARVLMEELLKPNNGAALLVLDPHGEYGTLEEVGDRSQGEFRQAASGYSARAKTLYPGDSFRVRISDLSIGDLKFLLSDLTEKMSEKLEGLVERIRKDNHNRPWTYEELIERIDDELDWEGDRGTDVSTLKGLRWRLNQRFRPREDRPKVFTDSEGTPLRDLFEPGTCTVLSLEGLEEREQQVVAAILLKRAYEARVRHKRQEGEAGDPRNALEYPVFTLLEEAHRFAPHGDDRAVSLPILKTILSEGRKFGIGAGMISQRPGKLDQNVLSQCMTQFLMRIINPLDQDSVQKGVESAGRELLRELPALSKGQAIVTGMAVRTPVMLRVRKALTSHGGDSTRASSEWRLYREPRQQLERTISQAPLQGDKADEIEEPDFFRE